MLVLLGGIIVALLQEHFKLITPDQTWIRSAINVVPSVVYFIFFSVVAIVRAPWNLHKEHSHKTAGDIEHLTNRATAAEASITNAPQPWVGWQRTGMYTGFTIENTSQDKDAKDLHIEPIESSEWILQAKAYHEELLKAGAQKRPFELISKRKSDGIISDSIAPFVEDTDTSPGLGWASFTFILIYSDHFGNDYERHITLSVGHVAFGIGNAPDIRNGPIRLVKQPCESGISTGTK